MHKLLIGDINQYKDRFDTTFNIIEKYNFALDDAKSLRLLASTNRHDGLNIVLVFQIISEEAQNSMLKLLEEENGLCFTIIVPDENILLETVRSRLLTEWSPSPNLTPAVWDTDGGLGVRVETFLKMSPAERLKNKEIIALYEKEVSTATGKSIKMKDDAHKFIIEIIKVLMERYKKYTKENKDEQDVGNNSEETKALLTKINRLNVLAEYIMKPGSSAKTIIEWVCVVV